jgi:hypothetical protein
MKPIFAIDPGPKKSAYVEYDPAAEPLFAIAGWGHVDNAELMSLLADAVPRTGVIEVMQYYGPRTNAGADIFTTCEWIGRFDLQWYKVHADRWLERLAKPQVSHHLCNKRNAEKAELHSVMYQRFGDGSRRSAVGVKKEPGPLYGLTGDHVWDALALAVTWHEQNQATTERALR